MKTLVTLLAMLTLLNLPSAEEYQCMYPWPPRTGRCKARIQIPGESGLTCVWFRRGDIISTEAGWFPEPDTGWRKVRTRPPYCLGLGQFYDPDLDASVPLGILNYVPTDPQTWLRPLELPVSSDPVPPRLAFIGLGP